MPNTLFEYRSDERQRRQDEVTAWQARLATAQQTLRDDKQPEAKAAIDAIAVLDDELDVLRGRLEAATSPVEMGTLANDIATKTRERAAAVWASLDAQAALAAQTAELAFAESLLRRSMSMLTPAQAAETEASADRTLIDGLKTRLNTELATVPGDATALLGSATFAAAEARFDGTQMPAALRALAEARYDRWAKRIERAKAVHQATQDAARGLQTAGGRSAEAAAASVAYQRARSALVDFANQAAGDLERAEAVLESLAAEPVLSAEVVTQLTDAGELAAREASQALALAYEQALLAQDAAQAARDAAAAAVMAQDPLADAATVDADPAVSGLATDLATAASAVDAADTAYTATDRERVLAWQSLVPDAGWQRLLDFWRARETLRRLESPIADLINAYDAAELQYATALDAAALYERSLHFATAAAEPAAAAHEHYIASARTRQLSALRGTGE